MEKQYGIYTFTIKWEQDGIHKWENQHKGLPEGRIHNGTSFDIMYKDDQKIENLEQWVVNEWWKNYKKEKLFDKNPSTPKFTVAFKEKETWCLTWFSHYTFDVGQTDEEALSSFASFVDRYRNEGYEGRCLMGAEDMWRWKGADDTDPPCRCEGCKEFGVIRINH